jgi:hypothetical protein
MMWDDELRPADEEQFNKLAKTAREKDFKALGEWFANCLTEHHKSRRRRQGARVTLTCIVAEWGRRTHELPPGTNRDRPELGVLRGVGYSVGRQGRDETTRHLLIDYLMSGITLPPIKDQSYMAEWGGYRTARRYYKLYRTLDWFSNEYYASDLHTRAVRNWSEDLSYLQAEWGFLSGRPIEPLVK